MNKFNLPESYAQEIVPYIIPESIKKLGIISDIHIPYHNIPAILLALDYLIKEKIDGLLINGDMLDFHMLSKFSPDPRKRHVDEELESARDFLDALQSALPGVMIYFKKGNHDIRYEKWLMRKAPELLGISEFRLEILLRLGEKKIECIEDKIMIKAGGLSIFHGHELNLKSISVNPARSLFLKTKVSSLCSHLHFPSSHTAKRADGHIIGCWSIGHLGEESPDYAPYNEWQHGFAIVDLNGKEFEVNNFKIMKGKVYRA